MLRIHIPTRLAQLAGLAALILFILRRPPPPATDTGEDSPFGATGEALRLWLAGEAMRQGELRLAAQATVLQSVVTRGITSLGWIVTLATADIALMFNDTHQEWHKPALAAAIMLGIAALFSIASVWPRGGKGPGFQPRQLLDMQFRTELEVRESLALGMDEALEVNHRQLRTIRLLLRLAWLCFVLAPVTGFWLLLHG